MNVHPNSRQLESIHISQSNHRKQTWWQIGVPLGVFVILIIIVAVLAAVTTARNSVMGTHYADISAMFLIIPAAIFAFFFLVLVSGFIYGLARLLKVLPVFSLHVRAFFYNAEATILMIMDQIVKPVLAVSGAWSALENFFAHFRKTKA